MVTKELFGIPEEFSFVIDFAASLYFHRDGPGIVTGMSNPEQPYREDQNIDHDWELRHIEAGTRVRQVGLYEMTPDAYQVIDTTPVEGLYLLTGLSGQGIMQGPVCGKLIDELITEKQTRTLDISCLANSRFEEGQLIRQYNVI